MKMPSYYTEILTVAKVELTIKLFETVTYDSLLRPYIYLAR